MTKNNLWSTNESWQCKATCFLNAPGLGCICAWHVFPWQHDSTSILISINAGLVHLVISNDISYIYSFGRAKPPKFLVGYLWMFILALFPFHKNLLIGWLKSLETSAGILMMWHYWHVRKLSSNGFNYAHLSAYKMCTFPFIKVCFSLLL